MIDFFVVICCRPVSRFLQHNFLQHNFCQYALEFSDRCITIFERPFFGVFSGDSRVVPHLDNSQVYAFLFQQSQALPAEIEFYSATMYARSTMWTSLKQFVLYSAVNAVLIIFEFGHTAVFFVRKKPYGFHL